MRRLISLLFTFVVTISALFSQSDCYLHINAGQSNAYKIHDELVVSWENTFKTNNTCDYFELVNISKGGTLLNKHVNGGELWDLNTSTIQNKVDFLVAEGCTDITYTMSWYQGEQDAFKTFTTYQSYKDGLEQIQTDYATFIGVDTLPMFIVEINADSAQWNLRTEDAVDQAGEDYANENNRVEYHDISSYDGSTYIHKEFNDSTQMYENIYKDGIHLNDWFVDQDVEPAIQSWVADEIGWTPGSYSCPCVPDTLISSEMFCEGESFVWLGEIFTTPGSYEVITLNYHGCDITNQLTLTTYTAGDDNCSCNTISFVHFADGLDIWEAPGGGHSKLINSANFANSGTKTWRLRGNHGSNSSLYSNNVDFSTEFELSFFYYPKNMGVDDYFLVEEGTNGNFTVIDTFGVGSGVINGVIANANLTINSPSSDQLRIRTVTTNNGNHIYLDDIKIQECPQPVPCQGFSIVDFEAGEIGIWASAGGSFSRIINNDTIAASSGAKSWRLRGDHGINSAIYSDSIDFNSEFEFVFHCYPRNVEAGDFFYVEARNNGVFEVIETFTVGTELQNALGGWHSITINNPAYDQLRIRSLGNQNNDMFYFDDLEINDCPPSDGCTAFSYVDFNNDSLDVWESPPGSFSLLMNNAPQAHDGKCWRLRGNEGIASSIYTDSVDFNNEFELSFYYHPIEVEAGDFFYVEAGLNGVFDVLETFSVGAGMQNDTPDSITLIINEPGYDQLRIRAETTANNEKVFIDNLEIKDCGPPNSSIISNETDYTEMLSHKEIIIDKSPITIYPNPISDILRIDCNQLVDCNLNVEIYDIMGRIIQRSIISQNDNEMNLSSVDNQLLIIHVFGSEMKSTFFKVIKQ